MPKVYILDKSKANHKKRSVLTVRFFFCGSDIRYLISDILVTWLQTEKLYGVRVVGRIEQVRAQYYAISLERKLTHPGVVAIVEAAHSEIFD